MRSIGVAAFGIALGIATAAQAQSLVETGAAMGVHDGLAGSAVQKTAPVTNQVRDQLRNSGNPSGSTCPIRILADYGRRVANEEAAKGGPKGAWAAAGELGSKNAGGKTWTSGSNGNAARAAAGTWAKNDKGTHAAPARRR